MTDRTGTSRRTFLGTSAAVGGALAGGLGFVPSVFARGSDALKVGLIGCGGRGTGAVENILEAAGTTYGIKIHAMADAFEDRARNCFEATQKNPKAEGKLDITPERVFVGLDAYQKVIDSCDLVILATPPGFRPQHIEAVVKAGKHLFTEKPVAVDGTGIRKVLAAAEEAKKKNIAVVAGTQRRHQAPYIESIKMIRDGAIGDLVTARVYWNQGNIWAVPRKDDWSDMEAQIRNWYHYTWLCGDHIVEQHVHNLDVANWAYGAHPVAAYGQGGQQVNRAPEYGESYDHFAVEFEYPDGQVISSQCRQIAGTDANVSETIVGTKGTWTSNGYRFGGGATGRVRERGINPYVQEHVDLLESITNGKPLNELQQVAESTMTAILGRLSAYTGKRLTWDEALNAPLDTFPKTLTWDAKLPEAKVAVPGVYTIS
jgi:predicted dehydrogenase